MVKKSSYVGHKNSRTNYYLVKEVHVSLFDGKVANCYQRLSYSLLLPTGAASWVAVCYPTTSSSTHFDLGLGISTNYRTLRYDHLSV